MTQRLASLSFLHDQQWRAFISCVFNSSLTTLIPGPGTCCSAADIAVVVEATLLLRQLLWW
jgi:hypothetical protein